MADEYTIYIDESGDEGLTGKSAQMFCLGAFLINNNDYEKIVQILLDIRKKLNKQELHASHINNHTTSNSTKHCHHHLLIWVFLFTTFKSDIFLMEYTLLVKHLKKLTKRELKYEQFISYCPSWQFFC